MPDLISLRMKSVVRAAERTFAAGADRSTFRLVQYSLQGNHAHFVVEAHDHAALGRGMTAIATRLALAVNRVMGRRSGRVIAERYHARVLRTPREVHRVLRYVLLNARKHGAKAAAGHRAAKVLLDPASSARWFDGWKRELPAAIERAPAGLSTRPTVARARSWLLRTGWRIHGLLDLADVPG